MTAISIESAIDELDRVFHREADFQHELAWRIREQHPDAQIRLERRVTGTNLSGATGDAYIDLWIDGDDTSVPVELKYHSAPLRGDWRDETFDLRNQGAEPVRRFDFVDDIARIESVVTESKCDYGVVVMLTNDHLYWQPPTQDDVIDAEFRLHDGQRLAGTLTWSDDVGDGTVAQKRDRAIELDGAYDLEWRDYEYENPNEPEGNTDFRYLLVRVE